MNDDNSDVSVLFNPSQIKSLYKSLDKIDSIVNRFDILWSQGLSLVSLIQQEVYSISSSTNQMKDPFQINQLISFTASNINNIFNSLNSLLSKEFPSLVDELDIYTKKLSDNWRTLEKNGDKLEALKLKILSYQTLSFEYKRQINHWKYLSSSLTFEQYSDLLEEWKSIRFVSYQTRNYIADAKRILELQSRLV